MSALPARILNSLTHRKSFVSSLTPTSPLCSMPISYETAGVSLQCSWLCRSGPMSSAVFHFLSLMSIRLLILSLQKKKKHYSNHFLILITKIAITRILSDSLLHMQPILYGNYSICFRHPNTLCLCLYVTFSSSSVEIAVLPKKPSLHANALKKVCLVLSKRLWDPALFYFGFALIILPCFSHFALLPLSFNLKYSICGCLWAENASYSFLRSTHTAWSPHHCKNRYF